MTRRDLLEENIDLINRASEILRSLWDNKKSKIYIFQSEWIYHIVKRISTKILSISWAKRKDIDEPI
jgi:hypothetical protein